MTEQKAPYTVYQITTNHDVIPSETDSARAERYGRAWVAEHLRAEELAKQLESLRDAARLVIQQYTTQQAFVNDAVERIRAELNKE